MSQLRDVAIPTVALHGRRETSTGILCSSSLDRHGFVQVTPAALNTSWHFGGSGSPVSLCERMGRGEVNGDSSPSDLFKAPCQTTKSCPAELRAGIRKREFMNLFTHTFTLPTPFSHSLIVHRGIAVL